MPHSIRSKLVGKLGIALSAGPLITFVVTAIDPRLAAARWLAAVLSALSAAATFWLLLRDTRVERALDARVRESEERFRRAFQDAPIGMALVSLDGRWLKVNRALAALLGDSEEALAGVEGRSLAHPDDRAAAAERLRKVAAGLAPAIREEARWTRRGGDEIRVVESLSLVRDGRGAPFYLVAQIEDVTERRRSEEALARSEERLRAAIESGSDAFFVLECARDAAGRPVDLVLVSSNSRAERLVERLARKRQRLVGTRLGEVLPELREQGVLAELLGVFESRRAIDRDLDLELPGGGVAHLAYQVVPIGCGVAVIGRDVTARRRLEEQLRRAQKIEAMGRLSGGVAHDFNNLLAVIASTAKLLASTLGDGDARREDVDVICEAASRGAALTRQLLTFSRRGAVERADVELDGIARGMEKLLRKLLPGGVEMTTKLGASGVIHGDPSQIEQVLMNLVVNARDAMPRGGIIRVATSDEDLAEPITSRFGPIPAGRYVKLEVRDSGEGMSEGTLQHLFEPFFTTKPSGRGTGFGLATLHGIVTQMRGAVDVASWLGKGSTFTIYLPRVEPAPPVLAVAAIAAAARPAAPPAIAAAPAPAATAAAPPRSTAALGGQTILVIDDEDVVRRSTKRILSREGYTVLEARNGAEGLEILHAQGARVDLVITDAIMPVMGGLAVIEEVAKINPAPPVVLVSGCIDKEVAVDELRRAPQAVLMKPFDLAELTRVVRSLIEGAGRRRPMFSVRPPAPLQPN